MNKLLAAAVAVMLVLAAGFGIGWMLTRPVPVESAAPRIHDTAAVLQQVQTLSELVTVKYVLQKVVILEDTKWYGDNRVTIIAHGIVKAGIDLGQVQPADLTVEEDRVAMTLPPPRITDVYLDEGRTHVLERVTGLMRTFDKTLEQNARRQAVDDLHESAVENGILRDAEDRARVQLTFLFQQLGFRHIELSRRDNHPPVRHP